MADNTQVASGTGDTVRDKDRAGVKTQVVGLDVGIGSGTEALMSPTNPLPGYLVDTTTAGSVALAATTNAVTAILAGAGTAGVQITGTWTGTLAFEATIDGTNWFPVNGSANATGVQQTTFTANAVAQVNVGGCAQFRVRCSVVGTGTASVTILASHSASATKLSVPLPAGTNTIGGVNGGALLSTTGTVAAAGTGTVGPLNVGTAGNVTFTVKNTVAASAWAGAPVIVFEQSDDNVSWGPLVVVRSDNQVAATTHVLPAGTASGALMFDAPAESITYVRARVTTGPTTNGITIDIGAGGMPFSPVVTSVTSPVQSQPLATGTGTTPALVGQVGRVVRANANVAQATAATLIAAPAAGTRIYVTNVVASNEGAALTVLRLFAGSLPGAAGAVAVINDCFDLPMAASGGGAVINFPRGAEWALPAATALSFAVTVATTWDVSVSYFVAP